MVVRMKRTLALLTVAALGLALAQVRVGIAFDAGGKFDRSFNQSAWEGAQRAVKDFIPFFAVPYTHATHLPRPTRLP